MLWCPPISAKASSKFLGGDANWCILIRIFSSFLGRRHRIHHFNHLLFCFLSIIIMSQGACICCDVIIPQSDPIVYLVVYMRLGWAHRGNCTDTAMAQTHHCCTRCRQVLLSSSFIIFFILQSPCVITMPVHSLIFFLS